MPEVISVDTVCRACSGTGLYHGFAEPEGVAVVCLDCEGSGKMQMRYTPFTGRQTRTDITRVQASRGRFIATGVGPAGASISYAEFLNGKRP